MKIKTLFMSLLLLLGAFVINAQEEPVDDKPTGDDRPCASFAQVRQECNEDGTVTITFLVSNNTECDASGFTIVDENGIGQSYPVSVPGQTVSSVPITYNGATPGDLLCLDVVLYGKKGRDCCSTKVCIEVDCCDQPGCCDMEAELISTGGCGDDDRWARIMVTGGTQPYTGPPNSFQAGIAGNFIIQELSPGTHTFVFTDSEGCEVEITITIPAACCDMEAEFISSGGCGPDEYWARIMVTGGTSPYTGPPNSFQAGIAGNFIIQGLTAGTHTFVFTDSEGCEVEITITIPVDECCGLEAEFISSGGCDPNDRWARIMVTGGTSPYTGPPNSFQAGTVGNFIVQGLSVGTHTLIFTDSEGCQVEITITIPAGSCDQFDNITLTQNSPPLPPIPSEVSATVSISIVGWCIPDMVEVFVNGIEVLELIAGSGGCLEDLPTGAGGTFCVEPCDIVEIVTTGNICPNQHSCPTQSTAFDVYTHSCTLKNGGGSDFNDGASGLRSADLMAARSSIDKELALYHEEMRLNASQSVKVFPNPVTDQLNISNSDPMFEYQMARIINSAGQVVHTENMSNLDRVQIDASSFLGGIYIIEMIDNNGNRIIEKFMKLD